MDGLHGFLSVDLNYFGCNKQNYIEPNDLINRQPKWRHIVHGLTQSFQNISKMSGNISYIRLNMRKMSLKISAGPQRIHPFVHMFPGDAHIVS